MLHIPYPTALRNELESTAAPQPRNPTQWLHTNSNTHRQLSWTDSESKFDGPCPSPQSPLALLSFVFLNSCFPADGSGLAPCSLGVGIFLTCARGKGFAVVLLVVARLTTHKQHSYRRHPSHALGRETASIAGDFLISICGSLKESKRRCMA